MQLCYRAMHPHDAALFPDRVPAVAAVCSVSCAMVKVAKKRKALGDSEHWTAASVAAAFSRRTEHQEIIRSVTLNMQ